jgi:nitroreductase
MIIGIIKKRRSIRDYEDKDIPYEDIHEILEAARWAPSTRNLQNWYFIIIKDKEKIEKIAEIADQSFIKKAPVIIVVCSNDKIIESIYGEKGKMFAIQNVAAAIENILLAATEKEIGSCWIGWFDEKRLKELLEVPEDINIHAIITLGYPKHIPEAPKRKSLSEIVFYEKWGNKIYRPSLYPLIEKLRKIKEDLKKLKI